MRDQVTHIRMPADLLDDIFVEVASITHQRASHVEGMLQTQVGIGIKAEERALLQLHTDIVGVDVLHPAVMSGRGRSTDMLLKHDDICVRNLLGTRGRQDGSCPIVDGSRPSGRRSCQQREQCEAEEAFHGDGWVWTMTVKDKESIKRRDKRIEQVSDGEVDVEEAIGKRWDGGKGEGGGGGDEERDEEVQSHWTMVLI